MVHLHDEEDPHYDDKSIQQELQQFFDEWHYRILHSGVALSWDRKACVALALDIFEMHGCVMTPQEKAMYVEMEDEAGMIAQMVAHLPMAARKTFEHFVLQLQLVLSTTTQIRHALVDQDAEEVAKCFDGGDAGGPGQQILKHAVVEAGKQIHEAIEMHKSWKAGTEARIARLTICQDEAEHARQQLEAVTGQLAAFKGEQNSKAKSVLVGIAANNEKNLVHTVFSTWVGWWLRHCMDKDIHDKFKKEIEDSEEALITFKTKQLGISRGILARGAGAADSALCGEILGIWYQYVIEEGHSKAMDAKLAEAQARFNAAQQSAKDASKSVMARMSAGSDQALLLLCFQSWTAALAELKAEKEFEELAKKAEQQFKDFMSKKSAEARGVLDRMSGSSDTGLLHLVIEAWVEEVAASQKEKEFDEIINGQNAKFKSLNMRQKESAKSAASRAHQLQEENTIMNYFYAWSTEARMEHVIKHYGGKLDHKKHQLESVQTMFRSFASQLEQGIGNTPRSQRKSAGRSKGMSEASGAPPPLPSN
jgi:hypothetical protein